MDVSPSLCSLPPCIDMMSPMTIDIIHRKRGNGINRGILVIMNSFRAFNEFFTILKFFSKYEYKQMVSDKIQIPRLPNIYGCQHFPFYYQLSSKSELKISLLLSEAVLPSFLIITPHPDVSSILLWRAIFMINKLKFFFSSTRTDGAFQVSF